MPQGDTHWTATSAEAPVIFTFFFSIYFYQLEANYFTILQWFLPYIDMTQPWIYMCSHPDPPSIIFTFNKGILFICFAAFHSVSLGLTVVICYFDFQSVQVQNFILLYSIIQNLYVFTWVSQQYYLCSSILNICPKISLQVIQFLMIRRVQRRY